MTRPKHAETLDLHLFVRRLAGPSAHAPGASAIRLRLRCPGCGADAGPLPFDRTVACPCGLNMHPDVAHLHVWKDACGNASTAADPQAAPPSRDPTAPG